LVLLIAALLTAAPVPSIAIAEPEVVGVEQLSVRGWVERFGLLLGEGGRLRIVTMADLAQLLGLERQKQLLGCDESSCLAEVTAGLGADGLIRVSVTRTGKSLAVSLKVLRTRDGSIWASATTRVDSDEAAAAWFDEAALDLRDRLAPAPTSGTPWLRWIPAGVGVAAAAGAVGCALGAAPLREKLSGPNALTREQISDTVDQGKKLELAAGVLAGAAAAGLITSAVWALVAPTPAVRASLVPTQGGAFFVVGVDL